MGSRVRVGSAAATGPAPSTDVSVSVVTVPSGAILVDVVVVIFGMTVLAK